MIPKNKASKAKERARVGVEVWGLWVGWAAVGEVGHPPHWFGPVTPLHQAKRSVSQARQQVLELTLLSDRQF